MATIALTEETFNETVMQPGITIVDWWASWCGPCKMFAPIFEESSERHTDVRFAKVNTEEQATLSQVYEIMSIPTLMVFRDGVLLFSEAGALPGEILDELITKVKEINMDDVRRAIAEFEAKQKQQ